uniref:hypothetical protein n=1 Tax=Cellvibrio fontiphilus TaxID=1815559 RepID=UPI002B4C1315|nr:hypothetical protein [Cellvibrio fontiphilus]
MNELHSRVSRPLSSLDQFPMLGYPEFSSGLQSHVRVLRLLAYGFLTLGFLLIGSALGFQYLWQIH